MNERIKELVKQAGGHISMQNLASNPVQHREFIELWDDKIEKFAELIVRECAKIAIDSVVEPGISVANARSVSIFMAINEQFGIKE